MKFDNVCQMVGGLYDWHPAIGFKMANYIFQRFQKFDRKIELNEVKGLKVESLKSAEFQDDAVQYRIHVFNKARTKYRRQAMWLHAGICLKLPNRLGYTRIFCFPCKCTLLCSNRHLNLYTFLGISSISCFLQVDGRSRFTTLMKSSVWL